jgi:hypothetical protein
MYQRKGSRGRFCSLRCYGAYMASHCAGEKMTYKRCKGGRRADLGGLYVRSSWEANWARYLNWLQSLGEIRSWKYEARTFEFTRIRRGGRFYLPDFEVVNRDGSIEYHEVKGYMSPESATKIKRMAKDFPEVTLVVVDRKVYSDVARKVSALIPNWESERIVDALRRKQ